MELEAHAGPRLHVPHPRQKQRRDHLAIGNGSLADAAGDLFQQSLARGLFQQPHQRLDVVGQAHDLRPGRDLLRGHRRQFLQKAELGSPRPGSGGGGQELTTAGCARHGDHPP
jgi:hypothetical protein